MKTIAKLLALCLLFGTFALAQDKPADTSKTSTGDQKSDSKDTKKKGKKGKKDKGDKGKDTKGDQKPADQK